MIMDAKGLRAVRVEKGWSQVEAAHRLGVSQPYLVMLERGQRRLTSELARRAVQVYGVPPTVVPPSQSAPLRSPLDGAALARDLAGLGYPALAYLRPRHWKPKNPGEVLLAALAQDDLEPRLVEALPWLGLRYALDWTWVVREAKVHDLQNRLGFVVSLARGLAHRTGDQGKVESLADLERTLERSRLAREDTLCRASMPEAERRWLTEHRPAEARRWNLLTDWTAEVVRYVA
jgi:transcriptional regulator with XRE-family HTH domain